MIIDYLLILGFTLRLMRLVIHDDLVGEWVTRPLVEKTEGTKWHKWAEGLLCPYCVGFWIGALVVLSYVLTPHDIWVFVAGVFTLNYIAAHISTRLE